MSPTGSVLGSVQKCHPLGNACWGQSIPGLSWKRNSAVSLGVSSMGGFIQCIDVGVFILFHEQNVAKEFELAWEQN